MQGLPVRSAGGVETVGEDPDASIGKRLMWMGERRRCWVLPLRVPRKATHLTVAQRNARDATATGCLICEHGSMHPSRAVTAARLRA
jgi:hypothetical protein